MARGAEYPSNNTSKDGAVSLARLKMANVDDKIIKICFLQLAYCQFMVTISAAVRFIFFRRPLSVHEILMKFATYIHHVSGIF